MWNTHVPSDFARHSLPALPTPASMIRVPAAIKVEEPTHAIQESSLPQSTPVEPLSDIHPTKMPVGAYQTTAAESTRTGFHNERRETSEPVSHDGGEDHEDEDDDGEGEGSADDDDDDDDEDSEEPEGRSHDPPRHDQPSLLPPQPIDSRNTIAYAGNFGHDLEAGSNQSNTCKPPKVRHLKIFVNGYKRVRHIPQPLALIS